MVDQARFTHCSLAPAGGPNLVADPASQDGWSSLIQCDLPRPPPDSAVFSLDEHRTVHDFWTSALDDATDLPLDALIRPASFMKALGHVLLLEPEEGGADFRYRIYGSRIAKRYGRDMTGKRVSDFPQRAAAPMLVQYRYILGARWGLYSEHDAPPDVSSMIRWCRLALPFVGPRRDVTRILVVNLPVDRGLPGSKALF